MDTVSVVIPTLDRPAALRRAIESVLRQAVSAHVVIDVVVVDNSTDGNAKSVVASIPAVRGIQVRCFSEPRPGVKMTLKRHRSQRIFRGTIFH
jgi:succinoglycan biosynthesis protein ExoM